jgi:hypothetical protein
VRRADARVDDGHPHAAPGVRPAADARVGPGPRRADLHEAGVQERDDPVLARHRHHARQARHARRLCRRQPEDEAVEGQPVVIRRPRPRRHGPHRRLDRRLPLAQEAAVRLRGRAAGIQPRPRAFRFGRRCGEPGPPTVIGSHRRLDQLHDVAVGGGGANRSAHRDRPGRIQPGRSARPDGDEPERQADGGDETTG